MHWKNERFESINVSLSLASHQVQEENHVLEIRDQITLKSQAKSPYVYKGGE